MTNKLSGMLLVAVVVISGCEHKFKSEQDELSYLSTVASPSPAQWERKNELARKIARESDEQAVRDRAEYDAQEKIDAPIRAKRLADEVAAKDAEAVAQLMKRAEDYEREGTPGSAYYCYKDVVDNHPNSPLAKRAAELMRGKEPKYRPPQ